MWGTRFDRRRDLLLPRFIPTHVGNTSCISSKSRRFAVHPHACGEHNSAYLDDSISSGSSPRMWGTRPVRASVPPRRRFIPTHVGNTPPLRQGDPFLRVHPHACGEHTRSPQQRLCISGSSPRMWGTLSLLSRLGIECRFIPTHVGNTFDPGMSPSERSVHPHACGEHEDGLMQVSVEHGSSPRMWGTLVVLIRVN